VAAPATPTTIKLRTGEARLKLIDQAAAELGQHRTEFILDVATRVAHAILLDHPLGVSSEAALHRLAAALDAPPRRNALLRELLSHRAPWETMIDLPPRRFTQRGSRRPRNRSSNPR
jgi:uncharacterized protein (DUF1778 family)